MQPMTLKEWERDVVNRQRNIVFPDTVLNEARFYRNILSGSTQLTLSQRLGVLLIAGTMFLLGCFGVADSGRSIVGREAAFGAISGAFWVGVLLCGIGLSLRAVLSGPEPVRKRRRGYRSSHRARPR